MSSAEGYRLVWYHSTRKAQIDAAARLRQVERALEDLAELEQKLGSPRSRYHHRAKVAEAVETILQDRGTMRWISTEINERIQETYRQERRGRPNEKTRYVRQVNMRLESKYAVDHAALAAERLGDGVFPLISNDRTLSDRELLLAYKGQPVIEKRFSQLKTNFRGGTCLSEGGEPDSGLALHVFLGAFGGVLVGAGTAASDGPAGSRELAVVSRGPSLPISDCAATDRGL